MPKEGSLPLFDLFAPEDGFPAKKRGFAEELESSLAGANQVVLPNPPMKPVCPANHTEATSVADGAHGANRPNQFSSTVPAASVSGISTELKKEIPAHAGQPAFDLTTLLPLTPGNQPKLEPGQDVLSLGITALPEGVLGVAALTGNGLATLTENALGPTTPSKNALGITTLPTNALLSEKALGVTEPLLATKLSEDATLPENAVGVTALAENALVASLSQTETGPEVGQAPLGPVVDVNWLPEKANVTTGQILTTTAEPEKALPLSWSPGKLNHLAGAGGQVKEDLGQIPPMASPVAEAPKKGTLLGQLEARSPGEAAPPMLEALAAALSGASVDKGGIQEEDGLLGVDKTHETRPDLPSLVGSGLATASEKLTMAKENVSVPDQVVRAILENQEAVSKGGVTEFHFKLHPPELGTVRVHLTAAGDWVSARLVVHEKASFQLLQEHVQSLRQRLCESGVSLGSFNLAWGGNRGQGYQPHPYLAPAWSGSTPGSFLPDYAEDLGPLRPVTDGLVDVLV